MRYLTHRPAPPLDAFVDYLWLFGDAPPHAKERVLPSGTLELVINLQEDEIRVYRPNRMDRFSGAVVSGPFRKCFVIDTREHASIMGVHFKPGGAFPFFDAKPADLADSHVDLAALWKTRDADMLRDQLCTAATSTQRFRILTESLLAHLYRPLESRRTVRAALAYLERSQHKVETVADRLGLSHRRLIEVFAREVGLTPKVFRRLRRFQDALALAHSSRTPDWARLALDCGYFDQSHLIRDFVAFSGVTPTDYLRQRSARTKDNHVPIVEGSNSSNTASND